MKRAIEFIEKNLLTPFSLDDVAAAEGLSTYHLHRVFTATFGHSIKTYVRKRRLTEAARLLRTTTRGVLDIALECQFESQASFTRAFRALFNQPPASFRREGPAHGRLHGCPGAASTSQRGPTSSASRCRKSGRTTQKFSCGFPSTQGEDSSTRCVKYPHSSTG